MNRPMWVIESDAFEHGDAALITAVREAGHGLSLWPGHGRMIAAPSVPVVFHGSLGGAVTARAAGLGPGAWCNVEGFEFTSWFPRLSRWALNDTFEFTTVGVLLADQRPLDHFVRPNSALKPFAGTVITGRPTAMQLGLGFYHDDPGTQVIVSPRACITGEWRFVIVDGYAVAGSGYDDSRMAVSADARADKALAFASDVAGTFDPPDPVYVLDVCESERGMRVVEINPFTGADLYACNARSIVDAVETLLSKKGT